MPQIHTFIVRGATETEGTHPELRAMQVQAGYPVDVSKPGGSISMRTQGEYFSGPTGGSSIFLKKAHCYGGW